MEHGSLRCCTTGSQLPALGAAGAFWGAVRGFSALFWSCPPEVLGHCLTCPGDEQVRAPLLGERLSTLPPARGDTPDSGPSN